MRKAEFLNLRKENFYLNRKSPNFSPGVCNEGVQDMLPQNTAPWHTEYFKPNALVVQHVQRGLSDLPLKQVIRPSRERCSPSTQRKAFFSPRLRTPRPHLPHTPFQPITFCDTLYSSSNLAKHSGLTHSSGLHFLMKAPVSHQTVCFSLAAFNIFSLYLIFFN